MEQILVDLFRELAQKHRGVIQNYLRDYQIYLGQHRILFRLEENPKITLTELTEILDVSKESLSMSIKRMEQAGLIDKERDTKDKRRTLLSLSPKGLETSKACRDGFKSINTRMFINLTEEEKESLSILFKKMIEGLEGEEI